MPSATHSICTGCCRRMSASSTIRSDAGSTPFAGSAANFSDIVFLRGLQDSNETLFYALLTRNIEEMMPMVYTPTVGLGCQRFSEIFRKPRGLFLSYPHKDLIRRILGHPRFDKRRSDRRQRRRAYPRPRRSRRRRHGHSDRQARALHRVRRIASSTTLPIMLDVGTDNQEHWTIRSISAGITSACAARNMTSSSRSSSLRCASAGRTCCCNGKISRIGNANRLLARYRDRLCTFNDDIQGTAAIAVGTLLRAINVTGIPLTEQRIAVLGAGSAGTGICALLLRAMIEAGLSEAEARGRFYLVDREGLLVEGMPGLQSFQTPFAQKRDRVAEWTLEAPGRIGLADVVANAHPTVLIGTSGQAHASPRPSCARWPRMCTGR